MIMSGLYPHMISGFVYGYGFGMILNEYASLWDKSLRDKALSLIMCEPLSFVDCILCGSLNWLCLVDSTHIVKYDAYDKCVLSI
jgi:hypothetical protein